MLPGTILAYYERQENSVMGSYSSATHLTPCKRIICISLTKELIKPGAPSLLTFTSQPLIQQLSLRRGSPPAQTESLMNAARWLRASFIMSTKFTNKLGVKMLFLRI